MIEIKNLEKNVENDFIIDPNTNRRVNAVMLMNRVEGLRARNVELEDEVGQLQVALEASVELGLKSLVKKL